MDNREDSGHSLISQMTIDPRVSDTEFKEIESDIRKNRDFQGGIKRSLLS
jgi:hypothetical protein